MATPKLVTGLLTGADGLPRAGWLTVKLSQVCIIPGHARDAERDAELRHPGDGYMARG